MTNPFHGSDAVTDGRLRGATDSTDHFYFICPKCGGDSILRLLDYKITNEQKGSKYNSELKSKASRSFTFSFKLFCEQCRFSDYVKISNMGWQAGSLADARIHKS